MINPAGAERGVSIWVSSNIKLSKLAIKNKSGTGTGDNAYVGGIFIDGSTGVKISEVAIN